MLMSDYLYYLRIEKDTILSDSSDKHFAGAVLYLLPTLQLFTAMVKHAFRLLFVIR
jgi:hypothetical protein